MGAPQLTHAFFDIGGVLGTNGWDREQRATGRDRFGLDEEFERRHAEVAGDWETGAIGFDEYLDITVFHTPRAFTREALRDFILAQSVPFSETIALARRVAASGRVRLMTLNNESEALNLHRIARFGIRNVFSAFFSSCWLRCRKPSLQFFTRALAIAQADPALSVFIDDREQNLAPARALGMNTIHYTDAGSLQRALAEAGLIEASP